MSKYTKILIIGIAILSIGVGSIWVYKTYFPSDSSKDSISRVIKEKDDILFYTFRMCSDTNTEKTWNNVTLRVQWGSDAGPSHFEIGKVRHGEAVSVGMPTGGGKLFVASQQNTSFTFSIKNNVNINKLSEENLSEQEHVFHQQGDFSESHLRLITFEGRKQTMKKTGMVHIVSDTEPRQPESCGASTP